MNETQEKIEIIESHLQRMEELLPHEHHGVDTTIGIEIANCKYNLIKLRTELRMHQAVDSARLVLVRNFIGI